jgi:hypothetical protein
VRHTEYIQPNELLLPVLCELVSREPEIRNKTVPTFGELLFYVTSLVSSAIHDVQQIESCPDTNAKNILCVQDIDVHEASRQWRLPSNAAEVLISAISPGCQESIAHYVAKTIENIAAQAPAFASPFASPNVRYGLISEKREKNTVGTDFLVHILLLVV